MSGGNGWVATSFSAWTSRITARGTIAIPEPAATHATIAWYEPNSITRSGTTFALPSHASRRRRYEQPVANAMTVLGPMSFAVRILGKLFGVIRRSEERRVGKECRS